MRHYLDELGSHGVDAPSFEEAWERYTLGFTWGYFLWVITRISSRAVVLLHIPRLGAALTDHDTFRRLGVDLIAHSASRRSISSPMMRQSVAGWS